MKHVSIGYQNGFGKAEPRQKQRTYGSSKQHLRPPNSMSSRHNLSTLSKILSPISSQQCRLPVLAAPQPSVPAMSSQHLQSPARVAASTSGRRSNLGGESPHLRSRVAASLAGRRRSSPDGGSQQIGPRVEAICTPAAT